MTILFVCYSIHKVRRCCLPGRVFSWIQSSSSSWGRLLNSPMIAHCACRLATPWTAIMAMTASTTLWCFNLSLIQPNNWQEDRHHHIYKQTCPHSTEQHLIFFSVIFGGVRKDRPVWSRAKTPWCTCEASGRASAAWSEWPVEQKPAAAGCGTPAAEWEVSH